MSRPVKLLSLLATCLIVVGCSRGAIEVPTKPVQPNPADQPIGLAPGGDGKASKPAAK